MKLQHVEERLESIENGLEKAVEQRLEQVPDVVCRSTVKTHIHVATMTKIAMDTYLPKKPDQWRAPVGSWKADYAMDVMFSLVDNDANSMA